MRVRLWVSSGFLQYLNSVRHAGPSEDAFHNRICGSPKSVVRYEEGAKLLRQLSFVPERFLKKAPSLELQLPSRVTDALLGK